MARSALQSKSAPVGALIAACCLLAPLHSAADSICFGADAELLRDTNVTRGPTAEDEKSDTIVSIEGYAARSFLLDARSGVVVRGGLRLAEHATFGDLSHPAANARAGYRFHPDRATVSRGSSLQVRHSGSNTATASCGTGPSFRHPSAWAAT